MRCFISGITGKMGQMLLSVKQNDIEICGGMDSGGYYDSSLTSVSKPPPFDVIIDFSHKTALPKVLSLALNTSAPLLLATTGYDKSDEETIRKAAEKIAILKTSNTSRGIAALKRAAEQISLDFSECDCDIVEKHHKNKKDSPSGTALTLKNILEKHIENIRVHSIRGGTVCGEHEIIFLGDDEEIRITHIAYSRKIFALGALSAARKLLRLPIGLYEEI